MQEAELIAVWLTAIFTGGIALAAWVQLPLISRQVRGLSEQIRLSREADQNAERRTREWETLRACTQYDTDPILEGAMLRVYIGSNQGMDYKNPAIDRRDMICVLNYLDSLATGIAQGLYIEPIVKDHMSLVVSKHVTDLIESGLISKAGYHRLMELHDRWSREDVNYRSSGSRIY